LLSDLTNYSKYEAEELLHLISKNDEAAFSELYDRFWKKMFAVAYNRLKEVQDAEDIVHDVFVRLWANRQKLEIGELENYLATAVKYGVLSKIKKRAREKKYLKTETSLSVVESSSETKVHYRQILELVRTEVEKLPERCRLIFKYSRDEGMPVKQIAAKLSISPKTVENQINKALRQLKTATRSIMNFFTLLP
jgi:RNA polymerase sigma-70 factor (ECF subfamily)